MQKLYEITKNKQPRHFYKFKHPPGWKFLGCKREHVKAPSKNKYARLEVSILVVLISQTSGI